MASQIFKVFSRSLHSSCIKRTAAGAGGFEKVEYSKVENVNKKIWRPIFSKKSI